MKIEKLLNELFYLLDNEENIQLLEKIKKEINDNVLEKINNYRNNPTVDNKKLLYQDEILNKYITSENNINYLIMEINNKFKEISKRGIVCESNKW